MQPSRVRLIASLAVASALVPSASAAQVTFEFLAHVQSSNDPLFGADEFCLISITFESAVPDSNPDPNRGWYYNSFNSVRFKFLNSSAPDFVFFPQPICPGETVESLIDVRNNVPTFNDDRIEFSLPYGGNPELGRFELHLEDNQMNAIGNASLPTCLNFADWEFSPYAQFFGPGTEFAQLELVQMTRGDCAAPPIPWLVGARWLPGPLSAGATIPILLDGKDATGSAVSFDWAPLTPGSPDPAPSASPQVVVNLGSDVHRYRLIATNGMGATSPDGLADETQIVIGGAAPPAPCPGDADGNGVVNFADITRVLSQFNLTCP